MRNKYPSVEAIRELPLLGNDVIPKKWEDLNGHVNVSYYLWLYNQMGWSMFGQIGITEHYFNERRLGFVDLENHTRYLSELHVGERVSVYGCYLAQDAKRVQGMVFVVNDDTDALACSIEFLAISMDLEQRRATAIPGDIATQLAGAIEHYTALDWSAPAIMQIAGKGPN